MNLVLNVNYFGRETTIKLSPETQIEISDVEQSFDENSQPEFLNGIEELENLFHAT